VAHLPPDDVGGVARPLVEIRDVGKQFGRIANGRQRVA